MSKPCTLAEDFLELPNGGMVKLETPQWLEWLTNNNSFRYVPKSSGTPYTVRKEKSKRGESDYWYGYKKINGKLHKRYVGKTSDLNIERLEDIARQLYEPTTPQKSKVTDKAVVQSNTTADDSIKLHKQIAELTAQLAELQTKAEKLQNEKTELQIKVTELHNKLPNNQPDYEAKRDRILASWKVGKRAESKERIKEAIDRFIRLLVDISPKAEITAPQVKTKPAWESKVDSFLGEVSWNG